MPAGQANIKGELGFTFFVKLCSGQICDKMHSNEISLFVSMFQNSTRFEKRRRSASQPPDSDGLQVTTAPIRSERAESTSSSGEQRGGNSFR